ncbi:CBS domain-containing protein [Micromonosporaceae bacterium DT194]|uniref:CBS domain-containing protein n=1 Tax=Melissospora conviva TaxID=3388432 RepID=UPI003C232367
MTSAWMVRAGRDGEREDAALQEGFAIAGWPELGDLSTIGTRGELRELVASTYPDRRDAVIANWTGQLWRFTRLFEAGDLVIVPIRSKDQLAIGRVSGPYQYRADAPPGFQHVRPVRWLRTDLPRSAVLPDLQTSLGSLLTVFGLTRHGAVNRILHLAEHGTDPGDPNGGAIESRDELLAKATDEAAEEAPRLTIRQLLGLWGAGRRTADVVAEIERELAEHGLTTRPPFTEGWIDNTIELVPVSVEPDPETVFERRATTQRDDVAVPADELPPVLLRIGDLEAASRPVCSVSADDSLIAATTRMLANDYSQLAVFDDSGAVRAVSWESIAKASIAHREATLGEASVPVRVVDHDASLLANVNEIYNVGYVLVRGSAGAITGIVTAADLTLQFANMATPTALIAEVERRLRRRVDEVFTLDEIRAASNKPSKTNSAADLTLGAYEHLLKEPTRYHRLKWPLDHALFVDTLTTVRKIRNELAHFSTTDPVTDDQLRSIEGLINMLRTVDPRP